MANKPSRWEIEWTLHEFPRFKCNYKVNQGKVFFIGSCEEEVMNKARMHFAEHRGNIEFRTIGIWSIN